MYGIGRRNRHGIRVFQIPLLTLIVACGLVPTGASAEMPPILHDLVNTAGFSKSDVSRIGDDVRRHLQTQWEIMGRSTGCHGVRVVA